MPTRDIPPLLTALLLDMPRAPKQTRANRANGAKAKARHEAAQSMEQLTAAHAALTATHAALNADLLSSREQYSQLREWHRSLLVSAGQREQQWELDLLGWVQQLEQLEEAFLQQLQGTQAQLTDTAAALEAAQKDLAAARTELAHTKQQLTTTNIKLEQLPTAHTCHLQPPNWRKQGVWRSLASITVDSAAGNIGRISGLAVSINALRRQQGLALIIFWPCVSHQIHNALHKAMTTWGKAEGWGRQGLQAQLALSIEQLCSLTKKHWDLLGVQHCAQPSEPSQSRWGSYVDACSSLTRVLKPVTAAVTGIMQRQGKAAPAWAGDMCSLLLDTDLICKLMVVAVVGQQLVMPDLGWVATEGGMHAFEIARHVEQLLDNLLDASTQDAEERFPYIFKHAQGLFVAIDPSAHTAAGSLLTAAASAPNPLALEGPQQWAAAKPKLVVLINKHIRALYEYLYEHSQLFFQLPHLLAAMGSSSALYAQKAAEQVLKQRDTRLQQWDVHQRQKQQQQQGGRRQAPSGQQFLPFDPAVFDPYGTLEDFLDDILELAAGQPCSPGLRTHLVEFFGAAPSSNHAVESSLQHTKHGNSAKQGLDAMIGSINNKLDPGALANIDLADFEARLLTLRKQKRDKETTSADDNREAKAARKAEESACMVDGNAKMVLNVPTQAPLQQLQQAFQQHARGADYSNTSAKEATRFTREQLRAYLLYHKVPPRDQPVGNTLVAGWQKAVQKHIAERGSPTGHGACATASADALACFKVRPANVRTSDGIGALRCVAVQAAGSSKLKVCFSA
ncbi:hypothetical protein QJQ45_025001 [Haematococcus lacustris]|nr:hypothetical protein QJQ45_025001 [Haematococcus lacustris]